jgi:plastocyanin
MFAKTTPSVAAVMAKTSANPVESTSTISSGQNSLLVSSEDTSTAVPSTNPQSRKNSPGVDSTTSTNFSNFIGAPSEMSSPQSTARDGDIMRNTATMEATTMFQSFPTTLPSTTLRALSPSAIHDVEVGAFGQLIFNPDQVNADVGDSIRFTFRSFNHSLIQSSLEKPCIPNHQFQSGFRQFNAADSQSMMLSFTINSPEPQFFFCQQSVPVSHCDRGMVFAINAGESMAKFLDNVNNAPHWKAELAITNDSFPTLVVSNGPAASGPSFSGVGTATGAMITGTQLKSVSSNLSVSARAAASSTAAPFLNHILSVLLLLLALHVILDV